MLDNINFDEFTRFLCSGSCSTSQMNNKLFSEAPNITDKNLFLLLAELCQTKSGRELVRNKFNLKDRSISIISHINLSNVRDFTGVVNVSFQSLIGYTEIVKEFQNGAFMEFSPPTVLPTKEQFLFQRFCDEFWMGAMRQIANNEMLAGLVYGLSKPVIQVLREATTLQILGFAHSANQRFSLRLGESFLEAIPTIQNADLNPNVNLVKIGYAAQSLACFADLPSKMSSTTLYRFTEVVPKSDQSSKSTQTIAPNLLKGLRQSNVLSNEYQTYKMKEQEEGHQVMLKIKKVVGTALVTRGLSRSQVSYTLGYDIWRVRQEAKDFFKEVSKKSPRIVDSRCRKDVRNIPEVMVQRLIFFCLYVTFAGERGLQIPDLDAFLRADDLMNQMTIKSCIGEHQMIPSDRFDDIKLLTQGLISLQRCPTCNLVSFYEEKAGEFIEPEDKIMSCAFCSLFSKDESLSLFSRFIKNSFEMSPENSDDSLSV